jgi:outer membrane lipoprotein-sorting protein
MKHRWCLFFAIALIILIGCSGLGQKTQTIGDDPAQHDRVLSRLVNRNEALKTFKGLGLANIRKNEKDYFTRLAWVGARPGKLRVEITGGPGLPKMGFSSDGAWLYYFNPEDSENPVKKFSSKNPSLKNFLSIPITSVDIVTFLSGRIPDYSPRTVEYRKPVEGKGPVLILKKEWWQNEKQIIYLNAARTEIKKLETYIGDFLAYRIEVPKMNTVKGYRVPSVLIISDDEGAYFKLKIDRFWVNASISPETFMLKPPPNRVER